LKQLEKLKELKNKMKSENKTDDTFKVYFVGNRYMGCYYVRCYLPMIYNGWNGSHLGLSFESHKSEGLMSKEMLDSDIIVFHRADTAWHHKIGAMLKSLGKKIVFDNDDTFKLDNFHPFFAIDEKGFKQNKIMVNNVVDNFILNSDLITTSTEYLKKEYQAINKNVVVLPNYVNPDDWDEPLRNETDIVRIGLVGSVAYHHDFEHITDVITKLHNNKKIQLVMFGLQSNFQRKNNKLVEKTYKKEYAFWDSLKGLETVGWVEMVNYFDTLNQLRLDLMVIPRRENNFNKAKSNVKFLEASMLEIPVIAQGFTDGTSPYEKDLNGSNGILVKDNKDWLDAVMDLVDNKDKRRQIGRNAYEYVLKNYNIKDHYQEWGKAYKLIR